MKVAVRARKPKAVEGTTETIAASVPTELVKEVRERIGKGAFSRFVAQALRHELVRLNRAKFIADFEAEFGSLDCVAALAIAAKPSLILTGDPIDMASLLKAAGERFGEGLAARAKTPIVIERV